MYYVLGNTVIYMCLGAAPLVQMVNNLPTMQDLSSIPGSRRPLEESNGHPLQYSCLENSMDRGAWWAQSMWLQTQK